MNDPGSRYRPYIGVVGPGEATAREAESAWQVGALLAQRGAVIVCGGLSGVMEACADGASTEGGTVVGVLPGKDRNAANRHLSVALATGLGELRNGVLVSACDALIAVGGSWGTLSEVALALQAGKPVVQLHGWDISVRAVDSRPPGRLPIRVCTPAEAVQAVLPRRLEHPCRAA
ncbi:TIGR00725 family protein [Streptomyces sp. NPDC001910]|uniref:TIGR00725 family protein n=1 Tax=Streptomyces sp. NPDC001910 TaxID=3154403 RepID=UPI00332A2EF7